MFSRSVLLAKIAVLTEAHAPKEQIDQLVAEHFRQVEIFKRNGMPGMALSAEPQPAIPTHREFHRQDAPRYCHTCKKRISQTRRFCLACLQEAVKQLMLGELDYETTMMVAETTTSEERARIIEGIQQLREIHGLQRIDTTVEIERG